MLSRYQALTVDKNRFYASDLYDLVFRPIGYDDYLRMVVREGGRAIGSLHVWRSPNDEPFRLEDARRLGRLEPFFTYALSKRGGFDGPLAESGEGGLVIAICRAG